MRFTLVSSWQEGASDNLPHECTAVSLVDAFWQQPLRRHGWSRVGQSLEASCKLSPSHGASRLVVLFGLVWGPGTRMLPVHKLLCWRDSAARRELEELQRSEEDLHSAFVLA